MDQSVTNEDLLADMRTLNQEHVPDGYPCVQTWQIDRLIEMIDARDQEIMALHAVVGKYRSESLVMRSALGAIASTTGSDDPCRQHVDTARNALSSIAGKRKWSEERPAVDGYYWTRVDEADANPEIVKITDTSVFANGEWQAMVWAYGEEDQYNYQQYMQERGGEWHGPIIAPEAI